MSTHKLKKLPKNTIEITLDIPWSEVAQENGKAFEALRENLTVEGFRKGKVPKEIATKHITQEAIYQEMLRSLLPKLYEELVKKENLRPIISPKIDLVKAKQNEDWQIIIKVAEKPEVVLGDYKTLIKDIKEAEKKADIWVPGKDKSATPPKPDQNQLLNKMLSKLLEKVKCEISELVLEEELNNRLARLVDDVQKIGLTVESYLKSKNTTIEEVKKQYAKEIEDMYKMEFILMEIADKEAIKVEEADLDKLFDNIKDEKEKGAARQNAYFYATVLRKQKTLDFLNSL